MSRCDATANGATTSKRRCAVDSPSRQSCCTSQHGARLSFGRHRRDTSKSIPPTRLTTEVTARRKSDFCHKRRGPTRSEQPLVPELKPVAAVASVEVSVEKLEIAIGVDLDRYIREEQAEIITSPTEKCKQSQNEQTQTTAHNYSHTLASPVVPTLTLSCVLVQSPPNHALTPMNGADPRLCRRAVYQLPQSFEHLPSCTFSSHKLLSDD